MTTDDVRIVSGAEWRYRAEQAEMVLLEFIRAYANTQQLDRDGTEIELFKAWIRGCAVLGIKAEGHPAAPSGAM